MNAPRLQSITVSNFRSIRGEITLPLDSPIVLIHGLNGAGKSSVLSALELALTGKPAGLPSFSLKNAGDLVNKGSKSADISLTLSRGSSISGHHISLSSRGDFAGAAALEYDEIRLFAERCYLPQSLVGRLFDVYQETQDGESALTRFVKEILGLDRLEALLDGLHPAGDIRRLRHALPMLTGMEKRRDQLERQESEAREIHELARGRVSETESRLIDSWLSLNPDGPAAIRHLRGPRLLEATQLPPLFSEGDELESLRQELSALTDRMTTVPEEEQLRVARLEASAQVAAQELDAWRLGGGLLLEDLLERVLSRFPLLERNRKLDTSGLADAALSTLRDEATRLERLLGDADEVTSAIAELQDDLEKCRERSSRLTDTLSDGPTDLVELTEFMASLIPHLKDNVCPVCDRDYTEVSDASLREHLIERTAAMNSEARRMQGVADALQESRKLEKQLTQRLAELEMRILSDAERMQVTEQLSSITSDRDELDRLAPLARLAEKLNTDERTARRALLDERNSISRSAEIRYAAQSVAERLNARSVSDSESLDSALLRLSTEVEERRAAEREAVEHRQRIEARRRELSEALDVVAESSAHLVAATAAANAYRAGFAEFTQRREALRRLASMAEQEFAPAVREVFSSSLNAVWRDLFVRLVPSEPFIPAFRIRPSTGSHITTELETVYRGGGTAGNPSYMLSAGNLNTAAITLFLALHLSVNPKLPWIVLDDPVQSMDEVHISQFAALLRTLSKQQDKRVILAVHERSLFEYLALELSPAYAGDKLITVELSRDDDGVTEVKPNVNTWMGDSALEAS